MLREYKTFIIIQEINNVILFLQVSIFEVLSVFINFMNFIIISFLESQNAFSKFFHCTLALLLRHSNIIPYLKELEISLAFKDRFLVYGLVVSLLVDYFQLILRHTFLILCSKHFITIASFIIRTFYISQIIILHHLVHICCVKAFYQQLALSPPSFQAIHISGQPLTQFQSPHPIYDSHQTKFDKTCNEIQLHPHSFSSSTFYIFQMTSMTQLRLHLVFESMYEYLPLTIRPCFS